MSLRQEFVMLARQPDRNIRRLCRRFEISPKTGYKWLARFDELGEAGLADRSRRPHTSPGRTAGATEDLILDLRRQQPAWGGRKLRRRLADLGHNGLPAASTITAILRRHGRLDPSLAGPRALKRFERAAPNELWQMDFKGHFSLGGRGRCHPLSLIDDHSRFCLALEACADERAATVQTALSRVFRRHGLPEALLMDNGEPWGGTGHMIHTALAVWLIRLGIGLHHGRPRHPQTQGKDERMHLTLQRELLRHERFADLEQAQAGFERWRLVYNFQRPHEALDLATPATRYRPSRREFPEMLPPIEYAAGDWVRQVQGNGQISLRGRRFKLSQAFAGLPVALRPTADDGTLDVFFCHQRIDQINLKEVSERW